MDTENILAVDSTGGAAHVSPEAGQYRPAVTAALPGHRHPGIRGASQHCLAATWGCLQHGGHARHVEGDTYLLPLEL